VSDFAYVRSQSVYDRSAIFIFVHDDTVAEKFDDIYCVRAVQEVNHAYLTSCGRM